jgi:microtubule-associated protein 1
VTLFTGERLIQFASENLVTEILIHPVVSTLAQCVRNLLSSFTRHRHIIHAGYTFANNGSWVLQDGTFSLADFSEAFQEIEVLRVIRAYENGISLDIHCAPEGDWTRLPKEPFTKSCKVRVNPNDVLTAGSPSISSFINYLEPFLIPAELENILESSDVVGNIRFSRPTLYVFPGGQGDAALFGINGFNMLLDGGFSRKACFWDFVRHLDRLDAVLLTRLNNSNVNGISAVLRRKRQNAVYPQIGHFFCNIQERKAILSPDGDKDKDPLLINLLDEGQEIVSNLRQLSLIPQVCYRDSEPINLYHKVGHGTLDMYVLSPAKDSKEVREFLQKWNNNDQKLFANQKTSKDFVFPLQNLASVCALLVWQPANPEDTITRILFPGSSPQNKIFEGLDRIKSLEFIKHPVCSEKSLAPTTIIKTKQSMLEKIIQPEKKIPVDNKKEKTPKPQADNIMETEMKNGEVNGVQPEKVAPVKKSDSTESEKSISKPKKIIENGEKIEKPRPKLRTELRPKARSDSQQRKVKTAEKKPSPTTPKKQVNGEPRMKPKASPTATPAKSAKDANNRKVVESKIKAAPKKEPAKPIVEKKEVKTERKPISRRPKDISKLSGSPAKKVNGVQKPDSISRRGKLDKEGTTDSSTVSTPSADQDSILKKDISKLTTDEIQNLKAQELADLKEEQEAVKEIEAVFRKGELHEDKPSDFRKIKDLSIDDKLENEEYLIIEKTEIEQDLGNETNKEEETQKIARDSEESEKQRKLSGEMPSKETAVEDKRTEIQDEVQKIITSATDIVKSKDEVVEASKEVSVNSPEDKMDVSTDKKDIDNEIKEIAQESQPDEKGSANIESGATTTAPTLPEDERMPLDEIKEDNGDQIIEEKHVKEDTKEKDVPVIQLPPKTFENIAKLPPVVGIRLDKQSHIRDIVKTPDEVADLPVHEEVDYEYPTPTEIKQEPEELKKEEKEKVDVKEEKEIETQTKVDSQVDKTKVIVGDDKKVKDEVVEKIDNVEVTEKAVDTGKTDVDVKEEEMKVKTKVEEEKQTEQVKTEETIRKESVKEVTEEVKTVISEDLHKKELSKSPYEEKDRDEHEVEKQKEEVKDVEQVETKKDDKDVKDQQEIGKKEQEVKDIQLPETIKDDKQVVEAGDEVEMKKEEVHETKLPPPIEAVEDQKEVIKEEKKDSAKKEEIATEVKDAVVEKMPDEPVKPDESAVVSKLEEEIKAEIENDVHEVEKEVKGKEDQDKKEEVVEKSETEVKEKDDLKPKDIEDEKLESLKEKLPDVPKDEVIIEKPAEKVPESIEEQIKEDVTTIKKIDEKLQHLKDDTKKVEETDGKKVEEQIIQPGKEDVELVKEDVATIQKINEKLEKLKEDVEEEHIKAISEVVTHKAEEPQHAEPVIITTDSLPESPVVDERQIDDKMELGRKSPKEREEDVIKIVASVAEVLKSDAPLEEFEGKIPFTIPYKSYTTELRETHITTVESPVTDENKTIKSVDEPVCPKASSIYLIEEERKIAPIHEEQEVSESKISKMMKESNELMQATSKMIHEIKQTQPKADSIAEETIKEEQDADSGTVHRMLVTTSSEDGGEEIEICPPGTITFSRSSESSGRSSPDLQSQKFSQKSSIADTCSEATVITKSMAKELQSSLQDTADKIEDSQKRDLKDEIKEVKDSEPVIEKSVCDTEKITEKGDIVNQESLEKTVEDKVVKEVSEPHVDEKISEEKQSSIKSSEEALKEDVTKIDEKEFESKTEKMIDDATTDTEKPKKEVEDIEVASTKVEEKVEAKEAAISEDKKEKDKSGPEVQPKAEAIVETISKEDIEAPEKKAIVEDVQDVVTNDQIRIKVEETAKEPVQEIVEATGKEPVEAPRDSKDVVEKDIAEPKPKEVLKDKTIAIEDVKGTDIKDTAPITAGEAEKDKDDVKDTADKEITKEIAGEKKEVLESFSEDDVKITDAGEKPHEEKVAAGFASDIAKDIPKIIDSTKDSEISQDIITEVEQKEEVPEICKKGDAKVTEVGQKKQVPEISKKDDVKVTDEEETKKDVTQKADDVEKPATDVKVPVEEITRKEIASSEQVGDAKKMPETTLKEDDIKHEEDISKDKEGIDVKTKVEDIEKVEEKAEVKTSQVETVKEIKETVTKEVDVALESAKEKIKPIEEVVESKVKEVKEDVVEKTSFLGGLVNDIGASLVSDISRVIDDAQKEIKDIKEGAQAKIEELKEDMTTKKETLVNAVEDFKESFTKDSSEVLKNTKDGVKEATEVIKSKVDEVKEVAAEKKDKVLEAAKDFEEAVVKDTDKVTEQVKEEIKETKAVVESKVGELKGVLSDQKDTAIGVVSDVKDTVSKHVEAKIEEVKENIDDTKEKAKSEVDDVCKEVTKKIDEKIADLKKDVADDSKQALDESKRLLEEAKDEITEKASAQIKDIESKAETAVKELKAKEDDIKQTIVEETKQLEDKFAEKKEEAVEKLDELNKDLTKAKDNLKDVLETVSESPFVKKDVTQSEAGKASEKGEGSAENKYDLYNGLESVEKMVTDVLTVDRKDASSKSETDTKVEDTKVVSSVTDKIDSDAVFALEKGVAEIKELMEQTKGAITSIVKTDSEKEEVLEKAAHDIEENYKVMSDMTKSVTFEKCDNIMEEEHKQQEDVLEKSAQSLGENYDTVTDMARSIVFEKCEKPISEGKVDENILEKSAQDIEDNYKIVSDMAKSVVFEHCEIPGRDKSKDEKSVKSDEKSETTERQEKSEISSIESKEILKEKEEPEVSATVKSIPDKGEKVSEEKHEESKLPLTDGAKKQVEEKEVDQAKKSVEESVAVAEEVKKVEQSPAKSSGKSSPDKLETVDVHEDIASKLSGKSSPALSTDLKDLAKEESGKSTPDIKDTDHIKVDNQDSLLSGKSSPGLSGKSSPILSGRSSPGAKAESKDSLLSGKSTPEHTKPDSKDSSLSEKMSPALSGDIKFDEKEKLEAKDSFSVKSSPAVSGKSSPVLSSDVKETEMDKSGKLSPDLKGDESESLTEKTEKEVKETKVESSEKAKEPLVSVKVISETKSEVDSHQKGETEKISSDKFAPEPFLMCALPKDPELSQKKPEEIKDEKTEKTGEKDAKVIEPLPTVIKTDVHKESVEDLKKSAQEIKEISAKGPDIPLEASSVIPEKKTETEKEKTETEDLRKKSLEVQEASEKKLSISDVQITVKAPEEEKAAEKDTGSPEDKQPDDKAETKDLDSIDSGIGTEVDSKIKKGEEPEKTVTSQKQQVEEKVASSAAKTTEVKDESTDKVSIPEIKAAEVAEKTVTASEKDEKAGKTSEPKEESKAGPSTTTHDTSLTPAKTSTEDLHLSGKSTPDIAEVEKLKEIQETLKHEKHIPGSSTPPTVPVSPIVKDISTTQAEDVKTSSSTPVKTSTIASIKDSEIRSCTPGSDDYEIGASTYSDISSGQVSRAPHLLESERIESDDDDDVPGSPMSVTSQVAHSRSSSRYDFEDDRIGTKMDPMNTSFYGALPDEAEPELEFEKAMVEHRQTRGEDLVTEDPSSYLYEITKAKFSSGTPEPENLPGQSQLDQINKNGSSNLMTASFMGELPSSTTSTDPKKDAFDSWGKPLGLPSPAPPNDNRGTPKKERKLPSNVSVKNKLNDDKKRSESPSKYKNKKFNPVYVDLTYVPHHGNAYYSYVDFFKRVRARYYVFSGIEPSREVYNALLEAKQTWDDKELEVTIIPTYDTDILGYWVAENEELLTKYKIDLSPSASRCTINLQDHETSCSAYRLEF